MSLVSLRATVEERVRERLLPALLEPAKKAHGKAWTFCDCDWCAAKRRWTSFISVSPGGLYNRAKREEWREQQAVRARASLRQEFDKPIGTGSSVGRALDF